MKDDPQRVWSKIARSGPDACWPWMASRDKRNYGEVRWGGRNSRAHRVVLSLVVGPPPTADHHACHHCDNPPCCNPAHLYWGTHLDNIRDMHSRGRASGGNALRSTCPNGHPYQGFEVKGRRRCLVCWQATRTRGVSRRNQRYRALRAAGFQPDEARRLSARKAFVPVIYEESP